MLVKWVVLLSALAGLGWCALGAWLDWRLAPPPQAAMESLGVHTHFDTVLVRDAAVQLERREFRHYTFYESTANHGFYGLRDGWWRYVRNGRQVAVIPSWRRQ